MGAHLFGVGGVSELNILLERVAENVQQLVLETDSGATVEEVVGGVAEQQHVKGVGAILHIDHIIFRDGGIDRLGTAQHQKHHHSGGNGECGIQVNGSFIQNYWASVARIYCSTVSPGSSFTRPVPTK